MNARFRFTAIALLALAFQARAQQVQDYNFMLQTNPYLSSANPAVLDKFSGSRSATAELTFGKKNGGLASISESPDCLEAGARTEAFVKISDRIAFYGKLSYSYFNGKGMGGQVMMDPEDNPVNFLESTDTTIGIKVRETYTLTGGMVYRFSPKLSAGIKFDYTSGDQTKMKDPRFLNYLMDLGITAGINYAVSPAWDLGLSLKYRSTTETVNGHIYGTTDKQYYIDIDKGGYWGNVQELEGDLNYLPTSNDRPLRCDYYGASFQFNHSGSARIFNELSFDWRTGYYGNRISTRPVFFEYSGFIASYNGAFLIPSGQNLHKLSLDGSYSPLTNSENSFRYDTPTGMETVVVYTGKNEILSRGDISAKLAYTFLGKTGGYRPETVLGLEAEGFMRDQTTTFYPHYRKHNYCRYSVGINAEKSLLHSQNIFTAGLHAAFRSGFGTPKEDGSYASGTTKLRSFDNWLNKQFEYETASRIGAGISLTYTRLMSEKFAAFICAKDEFVSLLTEPQYLKARSRNAFLITLGFNF